MMLWEPADQTWLNLAKGHFEFSFGILRADWRIMGRRQEQQVMSWTLTFSTFLLNNTNTFHYYVLRQEKKV